MKELIIARRYSSALLKLAKESRCIPKVKIDLDNFIKIAAANKLFLVWLNDEEVSQQIRCDLIEKIGKEASFQLLTVRFIKVLIFKRRIKHVFEMINKYNEMADDVSGIFRGVLTAADASSGKSIQPKIEKLLSGKLNKKIELNIEAEPELIGGLVIKLKHQIWDASFKRKLEEIKERLCQ